MGMAIDQAGEYRHRASIDPVKRFGPVQPADVVVIACGGNASVIDDDGPAGLTSDGAELRCINKEAAEAKRVIVVLHRRAYENIIRGEGWQSRSWLPAMRSSSNTNGTTRRSSLHWAGG